MKIKSKTVNLEDENLSTPVEMIDSPDEKIRREAARNIETTPKILEKLSHDNDKEVRRAVAKNPNSPASALMKLGAQFPTEILENPALTALLMENPNLFSAFPEDTLASIAKRQNVSSELLGHLASVGRGKGLLMALAQNGKTPLKIIDYLSNGDSYKISEKYEVPEDGIREVKDQVVHHVSVNGEVSADEARRALWRAVRIRILVDWQPYADLIPNATLPQVIKDDILALIVLTRPITSICKNSEAYASILEALAIRADKRELKLIQACPNCPPWVRNVENSSAAKQAIELNREASEALWPEATNSGSEAMLLALAEHPLNDGRVDVSEILDRWARDLVKPGWLKEKLKYSQIMLRLIISNPRTGPSTLEWLFQQVGVLGRRKIPSELEGLQGVDLCKALEKWIKSKKRNAEELIDVGGLFFETDRLIAFRVNTHSDQEYTWIALNDVTSLLGENPNTPTHILSHLARWGEHSVASNPRADAQMLRNIFQMQPESGPNIAKNPLAPPDLLVQLARSKDQMDILPLLAIHPSSPEEVLLEIATYKKWKEYFDFNNMDRKLLNHPNVTGRVLDVLISKGRINLSTYGVQLARDSRLNDDSYQQLAKTRDGASIRIQLAANPSVSTELLRVLASSKDEPTKIAASRALKKREMRSMS